MQLLRPTILMLCWLGISAFGSKKAVVVPPKAKPSRGIANDKKNNNKAKNVNKSNKKEIGMFGKAAKAEPKGRGGRTNDKKVGRVTNVSKKKGSTAVVKSTWISEQFASLSSFVMSRPAVGGAPYLLLGVRYLIVAMFFCLAAVAIIDSFSQVPSLFGEATIVVSKPR